MAGERGFHMENQGGEAVCEKCEDSGKYEKQSYLRGEKEGWHW